VSDPGEIARRASVLTWPQDPETRRLVIHAIRNLVGCPVCYAGVREDCRETLPIAAQRLTDGPDVPVTVFAHRGRWEDASLLLRKRACEGCGEYWPGACYLVSCGERCDTGYHVLCDGCLLAIPREPPRKTTTPVCFGTPEGRTAWRAERVT
jgi:hypothetical protein